MILMVSVQNLDESNEAVRGGADIVDVKNLQEAVVGSASPEIVKQVLDSVPSERHASVTLGVVPNQAGTVAMAVHTAGILEATSVKVGFRNTEYHEAVEILLESKKALVGMETKLIGSLFADNKLYDGLDPSLMLELAQDTSCDGFLIDTLTKDGRNLFDFMSEDELREMVFRGKELGISTALSGHLKVDDLDELARINPDIVGVRGAVCSKGERANGVYWKAVAEFKRQLVLRESGEIDVFDASDNDQHVTHNGSSGRWLVIDGTGKTCASILASLSKQMEVDQESFVEVIVPSVLNAYDVILWAEKGDHSIITQRTDSDGSTRILVRP